MEGQLADTSLIHRKVVLADVLRLSPHPDQSAAASSGFSSSHARRGARLALRFGNPLVRLCCVRVLGVVVQVLPDDETRSTIGLYIDDSTGVIQVEYPIINLTYLPKRPEVGDLYDFLGEIYVDDRGTRFINAYGMDYKKDTNWEALRYLEIVDMYKNHYYKDTLQQKQDARMDIEGHQDYEQDEDRLREYEQMSQPNSRNNASTSAPSSGSSQNKRFKASPPSSVEPPTPAPTTDSSANDGAAIEAMLREKGSATLAEIARSFPRCSNLVGLLENMMLDGLLYEKDGRYHPL